MAFFLGIGPSACVEEEPAPIPTCTDPGVTKTTLPDVPLIRESTHLDIHSSGFVCLGTAVELERHVTFVADTLNIDLRADIPLVLSETSPEACRGTQGYGFPRGCATLDGVAFAVPGVVYHELNHSVACQLRSGARVPALVEGLAVMFEPQRATQSWLDEDETLLEVLEADYPHVDYDTSGHFFRWLFERNGADTLAELYRMQGSTDDISTLLSEFYDADFVELEAQYQSEAPWKWVPLRQCADLPHISPNLDGEWRFASVMDCDDAATLGPYLRDAKLSSVDDWNMMYQSFTFTLDTELTLDYALEGVQAVILQRCPLTSPLAEDESVFDKSLFLPPIDGAQGIPTLSAGTWRADVLTDHGPPLPVEVAFWERPG